MSFQAYLDNIEEKTGKTPNEFIAEAKKKEITEFKDIIAWLKKDYDPGTDHARAIAALYDALIQLAPSPIVALNRAVAVSMAFGPAAGLEIVDTLTSEPALKSYHLLPSVRGDLLAKLGRHHEACQEFKRAAELTRNAREREVLLERAATVWKGT